MIFTCNYRPVGGVHYHHLAENWVLGVIIKCPKLILGMVMIIYAQAKSYGMVHLAW